MELYEAFISSVPAHLRVTMAVRGRYQAYVETEGGAGSLVVKTNIDAVSGATVTTKGITKGANAALAAAEAMA